MAAVVQSHQSDVSAEEAQQLLTSQSSQELQCWTETGHEVGGRRVFLHKKVGGVTAEDREDGNTSGNRDGDCIQTDRVLNFEFGLDSVKQPIQLQTT